MSQEPSRIRDANATLGTILTADEGRDAVHIAVVPVEADQSLSPGQHIGLVGPALASARAEKYVGIVDPYLPGAVAKGQRFWMFLYPRTITSLRHVWEHPDIPGEQASAPSACHGSALWMEGFAARYGRTAKAMIEAADDYVTNGNYLVGNAEMEGEWVPDVFWDHYENITGKRVKSDERSNFFSCSC